MEYIPRLITEKLVSLSENFPAVVLTGARQVGKSTLLDHVFGQKAGTVVFDPVKDVENARQDPDLFLDNHRLPLILDEIQYAPELVPAIKRRIDRLKSNGLFLITGSQQWGVMKTISESLAGRAAILELDTFSNYETSKKDQLPVLMRNWLESSAGFQSNEISRLNLNGTLFEQLWQGYMPKVQFLEKTLIPDYFESYQRTYLERDVRSMMNVSDIRQFARFIGLMGALSGQEINYSELGRDLGLSPHTAKKWTDVLASSYQWMEIPPFSLNPIKRLSGKPKGYLIDTGYMCWAQSISSPKALASHPLSGAVFETAVVNELRKQFSLMSPKPKMFHWRIYSGAEVDLIIEYNGRFFPIEIRMTTNPSRRDCSGFLAFRKHYPNLDIASGLVISPVDTYRKISDLDFCMPWDACIK